MGTNVEFSDDFVEKAKRVATIQGRSVSKQIEFYFRIAIISKDNSDLSFSLIHEILMADSETAVQAYEFKKSEI
jgi:hypothetical protein